MKRTFLIGALGMASGIFAAPAAQAANPALERFFEDFAAEWMRANPNQAVASRYFSGPEQDALERELTPQNQAWRKARAERARHGLRELARFDAASLTDEERVSAELMRWQLGIWDEAEAYDDFRFPFEQQGGVNVALVNALVVVHPLRSARDADNYLARLVQVRLRLEEALADARRLADKRMIPPRFILRATLAQMRQFVASPPAQNPLVASFAERLRAAGLAPQAIEPLRQRAEAIAASDIYPSWRTAMDFLESLVPQASDDAGLWRFAGGAQAYAFQLRRFTSTRLTPKEIHEIGLREVRRIEDEMEGLLLQLGRTQGSLNERLDKLEADLRYPHDEQGRKRIMADIDAILRDAEARAAPLFGRRPKAGVVAQPYPRFREAAAAASYTAPPRDGSRPGIFQMPLRPERMTKFGLRTLVYHETIPGHHLQLALELENEAQPRFRRVRAFGGISAYGEGWALYAEHLAAEAGWYEGDLEGRLGQLDAQLFRARRLVVDTGIHAMRWTRSQAIAYGIDAPEIERYVMNPGQACAYMLGKLKMLELRERARRALGGRFVLRDFHDLVLATGTVPLELLEREVERYITSRDPRAATRERSSSSSGRP